MKKRKNREKGSKKGKNRKINTPTPPKTPGAYTIFSHSQGGDCLKLAQIENGKTFSPGGFAQK